MTRVFTEGVFDLLHVGHVRALERARALGDDLLVGVHSDEDVAKYKRTPIIPFEQRIELVRSLRCVSEAVHVPLAVDEAFYRSYRIDVHVQGNDVDDHYETGKRLEIIRFIGRDSTTSTTEIIERVLAVLDCDRHRADEGADQVFSP